mmetsp:Transcript_22506/g.51893  ORF Transcript_22506/g.51893 Transcript_22506/m.51893 type:complete len:84 (+) Transcript_22506:67-318(+)
MDERVYPESRKRSCVIQVPTYLKNKACRGHSNHVPWQVATKEPRKYMNERVVSGHTTKESMTRHPLPFCMAASAEYLYEAHWA